MAVSAAGSARLERTVAKPTVSRVSRPDEGSSRRSSNGSWTRARPSSTRRPLPLAQRLDRVVGDLVEAELAEQLLDAVHGRRRVPPAADEVLPEPPSPRCTRSATIKWSRGLIAGEQLEPLEGAADSEAGPLVDRRGGRSRRPSKQISPASDVPHTVQAVEQRRLPGAVRADKADGLTGVDADRDVVECHDAPEALADANRLEQRHLSRPTCGWSRATPPHARSGASSAIPRRLRGEARK